MEVQHTLRCAIAFVLTASCTAFASEPKIIETENGIEVIYAGEPSPEILPPAKTYRKINDEHSQERKEAIKSLLKMLSLGSVGSSYSEFKQNYVELATNLRLYQSTVRKASVEDESLQTLLDTACTSYELSSALWKDYIISRSASDQGRTMYQLQESRKLAETAIKYYEDNWK